MNQHTLNEILVFNSNLLFRFHTHMHLLCSPLLVPQITGGALFPGAVTEN